MNLKDRGITVGDLLIVLIIIILTLAITKIFSKDKKSSYYLKYPEIGYLKSSYNLKNTF